MHVQHVDRVLAQFSAEREWDSDQRRVRKCGANFEIRPTLVEAIVCFARGDVNSVVVGAVDLRQRLD